MQQGEKRNQLNVGGIRSNFTGKAGNGNIRLQQTAPTLGLLPTASTTRSSLEELHIALWPCAATVRPAATWSPPPLFPL
eukprot:scaffold19709_cov61-Attheya_sp.AAC.4